MKNFLQRLVVVSLLALGACGGASDEVSQSVDSRGGSVDLSGVSLTVGISGDSVFEIYQSISGLFDDVAYSIDVVKFDSSGEVLEALRAGAIDVAHFAQATNVILAQGNSDQPWTDQTTPLTTVAAWSNPEHPGFCLVVRDPAVTSPSELSGMKVGYSKGTLGHVFFEALVEEFGLTGVESAQMPPPEGKAAFLSGSLDALIAVSRTARAMEQERKGAIIDCSSRIMPYFQVTVAQPPLLGDAGKSEALRDLIRRSDDAAQWASEHFDEVVAFNLERGVLDQESAEFVSRYEPRRQVPLAGEFQTWLQRVAQIFSRTGVTSSDVDTDVVLSLAFDEGVVRDQ
ncbi:MAG: hypothetical protein RLZ37_620 [Actinomycetota bacterium]|jgi:ABC-type nitrate/sulfonate/bicarbonate transport system substrate-binding protein